MPKKGNLDCQFNQVKFSLDQNQNSIDFEKH